MEREVKFNGLPMDNMSGQDEISSGWTHWTEFLPKVDKCHLGFKNVENYKKKCV